LQMARTGEIPAHPIGTGPRRTWRFRLSELAQAIATKTPCTTAQPNSKRESFFGRTAGG
jgi:hypothetical protein